MKFQMITNNIMDTYTQLTFYLIKPKGFSGTGRILCRGKYPFLRIPLLESIQVN